MSFRRVISNEAYRGITRIKVRTVAPYKGRQRCRFMEGYRTIKRKGIAAVQVISTPSNGAELVDRELEGAAIDSSKHDRPGYWRE